MAGEAEFRIRGACIACGSPNYSVAWEGSFEQAPVAAYLRQCYYSVDVTEMLHGKRFELVKCDQCDQLYHRHILADHWLSELYSNWIDEAQVQAFENASPIARADRDFESSRQMVKHIIRLAAGATSTIGAALKLLDFGSGGGRFLAMAAQFGFDAYGVDVSEGRDTVAAAYGVRIFRDLRAFDDAIDRKLDAVTLFQVLEHLPDPLLVLQELASRLRSGGQLVVEVPDCSDLDPERDFEHFHAVQPLEHVNAFTPESLKRIVERAGFRRIRRPVAHVTTKITDLVRSEATRMISRRSTAQYFRRL